MLRTWRLRDDKVVNTDLHSIEVLEELKAEPEEENQNAESQIPSRKSTDLS